MNRRFYFFVLVLFCLGAGYALAQPVPATDPVPRVVFPRTVVGNTVTVGNVTADAANAAKFSFGAASNGAVFANTGANIPTAGGASVPVAVAGEIPKAKVAGAIGRFMVKIAPTAYALNAGVAVYDLAKELNFLLSRNPDGTIKVEKTNPDVCTVAPCFTYRYTTPLWSGGELSTPEMPTRLSACAALVPLITQGFRVNPNTPGWTESNPHVIGNDCWSDTTDGNGNSLGSHTRGPGYVKSVAPSPVTNLPSSQQEFIDAVAAKSGWPSTSALARATVDAIKSGESLAVEPKTLTGPATAPVSQTVTNNTTNNTTKTETVTQNFTYDGPKVTITNTTNYTTVDNSTGATILSETKAEKPVQPEPAQTCGLPDTPACAIDESGMPNADSLDKDKLKNTHKSIDDMVNSPAQSLPVHPTINWAFLLPTGCAVIALPAFEPYVSAIDVCQFQGVFHDIMSIVWLMGGIFGAISLFMKNALAP